MYTLATQLLGLPADLIFIGLPVFGISCLTLEDLFLISLQAFLPPPIDSVRGQQELEAFVEDSPFTVGSGSLASAVLSLVCYESVTA